MTKTHLRQNQPCPMLAGTRWPESSLIAGVNAKWRGQFGKAVEKLLAKPVSLIIRSSNPSCSLVLTLRSAQSPPELSGYSSRIHNRPNLGADTMSTAG